MGQVDFLHPTTTINHPWELNQTIFLLHNKLRNVQVQLRQEADVQIHHNVLKYLGGRFRAPGPAGDH